MSGRGEDDVKEFVFLLVDKFSMIAFASAIEPLRVANRMAQEKLYSWRLVSADGEPVSCSNGTRVMVDGALTDVDKDAMILVCAGLDVKAGTTQPILSWLRKQSRRGVGIGAVCTGTYTLVRAVRGGRRGVWHLYDHPADRDCRICFAFSVQPRPGGAGGE